MPETSKLLWRYVFATIQDPEWMQWWRWWSVTTELWPHKAMEVFKVSVNSAGHRRVSLSKRSLASLIFAARYGDPPVNTHTHTQDLVLLSHISLWWIHSKHPQAFQWLRASVFTGRTGHKTFIKPSLMTCLLLVLCWGSLLMCIICHHKHARA